MVVFKIIFSTRCIADIGSLQKTVLSSNCKICFRKTRTHTQKQPNLCHSRNNFKFYVKVHLGLVSYHAVANKRVHFIESLSTDFRETKAKAISLANHNISKQN